nr:tetratricopeptide repeat protein [Kofleriaceae bacterium]
RGDARWVALRTLTILANPAGDHSVRARATAATYEDAANAATGEDADSIAALRLRTAQLFIDAGAAAEAATMFEQVENHWPASSLISDLHALASRRAGQDVAKTESETTFKPVAAEGLRNPAAREHAYARMMRQADVYMSYGDHGMAQQALASALELRPGDPGATAMSELLAHRQGDSELAVVRALGRVQFADQLGDPAAIADAQVQLADLELWDRHNVEAARTALQIAYECAPQRWSTLDRMVLLAALRNDPDALALARQRQADLAVTESEFASHHYQDAAATLEAIGADSRRVLDLSRKALQVSPPLRGAMLFAERAAQALGDVQELAQNDDRIAAYFTGDARSQAAFLTRAGVYWVDAGQHETAIARFRAAEGVVPAYIPALEGWRRASLRGQLWLDVANAALREAIATHDAPRRTKLFHLAGVVLMEKALVPERAIEAFRYVLDSDPSHRDAFLRTRILLSEEGNHDELALVLEKRLEVETDPSLKRELHRAAAELHRNFLSNREGAMTHYREILRTAPNDIGAQTALADIAWELGDWHGAAQALIARARLERSPEVARSLAKRLGMLYADRLGEPATALGWYERALVQAPDDEDALVRVAELAGKAGDWNRAMAAAERLVKSENDADARVAHWHRVADIFENGFGDTKRAERAFNQALDGAPSNAAALDGLIKFYKRRSDTVSIRVHLGRVASAVRARIEAEPTDIEAYRVLARTMEARHEAGVDGSIAIARSAHDMVAILTGQEPVVNPKTPMIPTPSSLLTVEADEVIFPPEVQPELRQLFQLLGERLSKHVGVDLRHHGVTRSDKIGNDQSVARAAIAVGGALGFADIEVYVSTRQPMVFAAEPTHPVSVVIGSALAGGDRDAIRFATGAALKLAQSQLAVAARLPVNELGVLIIALVRLFQPDFPAISVDLDAVAAQMQRLRRLIPSNAMNDLRPFALAIDASRFNHVALAAGLATASYRAGVASAQSLAAGLKVLAIRAGMPVTQYVREPVARALIQWALSEDHGIVAR